MSRAREFDVEETLDRAMRLFWQNGYTETSMRDLVEYTGVAQAGLYSAFGSKHKLYQAALAHYDESYGNWLFGPLENENSGVDEIFNLFNTILAAVKSEKFQNGCLMCNTAIEFGNDADEVLNLARNNVERMSSAIQGALRREKKTGRICKDLDPASTADFLVCVFYGVAVFSRSKTTYRRIKNSISTALNILK